MTAVRRRIPELTLIEHEFSVPLDHDAPGNGTISVFARELIADRPGADELPLVRADRTGVDARPANREGPAGSRSGRQCSGR